MKTRYIFIQLNKFPNWCNVYIGTNKRDTEFKQKIETLLQVQSPQQFLFEPYSADFAKLLLAEPRMQFNRHDIMFHWLYNYLFVSPYRGDWKYLTREIDNPARDCTVR